MLATLLISALLTAAAAAAPSAEAKKLSAELREEAAPIKRNDGPCDAHRHIAEAVNRRPPAAGCPLAGGIYDALRASERAYIEGCDRFVRATDAAIEKAPAGRAKLHPELQALRNELWDENHAYFAADGVFSAESEAVLTGYTYEEGQPLPGDLAREECALTLDVITWARELHRSYLNTHLSYAGDAVVAGGDRATIDHQVLESYLKCGKLSLTLCRR
jgi:hypothetical protein